jgi:L-arabinonolactonase
MSAAVSPSARLAVDSRCELGEGVLWCERRQQLWWTDIESSRLWRHRPERAETRSWRLPDRLGSLALCESGRLLLGFAAALHVADADAADADDVLPTTPLATVPRERASLRVNDGRADRCGNFVFGTLNEDARREPIGRFYQYSARAGLRPLDLAGVAIPNSLCFDLDGRGMYYCDSLQPRILRCDYDAATATVGHARVFAELDAAVSPDGAAIDARGRLWSAQWGAGRVVCHGADGVVVHQVPVPARHVSCLTFAGARLDDLYITTARAGLDADRLRAEPEAGGLYRAHVAGAVGLPEARFDDR